jgi:hypothetical protein
MKHHQFRERDAETVIQPASCLTLHRGYRCQHAGACCTAGWPIPVERAASRTIAAHFGDPPLVPAPGAPPDVAGTLPLAPSGACAFFEPERGRLCAIHRVIGPDALPHACRQFPRVVLRDGRGLLVSLSHFCPTAARLLLDDAPMAIVAAPASLTLDGEADGLDASEALPPLLCRGILTDIDGYARWEARGIETLARADLTAAQAVSTIAAATRRVQDWSPGEGSLSACVDRAFEMAVPDRVDEDPDADAARAHVALAAVPEGVAQSDVSRFERAAAAQPCLMTWWPQVDRVARAYLAARLFGNWIAYHGDGLHAVVEYLRIALAVLRLEAAALHTASSSPWQTVIEAARKSDQLLVHLADPSRLARRGA